MRAVEKAIQFAVSAHTGMQRKGKIRPYILHPIEAMTIVAGLTDDEEVIAAAVLHDVVEDAEVSPEDIEKLFGNRVRDLVMAESENKMRYMPVSASWKERKMNMICRLQKSGRDVKMICLGDKLSNLREISRDYEILGETLWERFNEKDRNQHAWYYRTIYELLMEEFQETALFREYRELLKTVFPEENAKTDEERDRFAAGNSLW